MNKIRQIQKNGVRFVVGIPDYPLSLWVDHFFIAHGKPFFSERRVYPNNHVDLFFNLANVNKGKLENAAHDFEFRNTIISGLRSSFMRITPTGLFDIAGLRFKLFGFACLFNIPAIKIVNENLCADDVLGAEVNGIRQQLGDCTDLLQRLSILEDWTLTKASSASSEVRLWNRIEEKFRSLSFRSRTELSSTLGYSYRHSLSIITGMTGLHPKMIERIYRLDQLLATIGKQSNINWANIAYQFGYSDQSHMIREFRTFTGSTPKEFKQQAWFAPVVHEVQ